MKSTANKLTVLKNQAKRAGWLKYVRNDADELAMLKHGCSFNVERGELVVEFCPRFCRIRDGKRQGEPFTLLDFQREEIVMPLFGWEMPDGHRRFRKAYITMAKKNGKSALLHALGLYMGFGDGEQAALVMCVANSKDQAKNVFDDMEYSATHCEELSHVLTVFRSEKSIRDDSSNEVKAMVGVPKLVEGKNAYCIIADELHCWTGRHLWDAVRFAGSARDEPLLIMITTAGDDTSSVCYEQYDYAKDVLKGKINDPHYFGAIWEAGPDDNPTAVATIKKANPGYDLVLNAKQIKDEALEATRTPTGMASFRRYKLNQWVSAGASLLPDKVWGACGDDDFDETLLLDRPCYGGFDLAKIHDTTAFALAFEPIEADPFVRIVVYFWLPADSADRLTEQQGDIIPWRHWEAEGAVTLTAGDVCDYGIVKRDIGELASKFNLVEFAYDPYQAESVTQDINTQYGIPRHEFRQTPKNYAEPVEEFIRLCLLGELRHQNNPVMNHQVGNAVVARGLIQKPTKNDHRKVDGVQAAIMALGRLMLGGGGSAYDEPKGDDSDHQGVILF
ncbi:MAG: terminase large subunit [Planctomycetaceae bacterium]